MAVRIAAKPKYCIETRPTSQSVWFSGEYINLSQIAVAKNMYPSLLSRIFSGQREPSLKSACKVADALGMTVDDFLYSLEAHIAHKKMMVA